MELILLVILIPLIMIAALAWLGSNYLLARRPPDEADAPDRHGLTAEAVEFEATGGLKLRGWYVPHEGATKTVILCSGANGSLDADVPMAPWLHEAGYNVLLFNWRAHGNSDGEVVTLGFSERYDLIAAVQFAKAQGAERVGALGFSMGGTVALATAAVYEDVNAVVADSPYVYILSAVAGGLIERGVPEGISFLLARLFVSTACLRTQLNLFDIDLARWISRVAPRPLLLIYGDQDVIAPKSEVDTLVARAREPKEIWRVPDAAHRASYHSHPDEYRQRVLEFFNTHL